ncbi:MAG: DNA primase [Proteobacteria bacterium]|nr:DNA primase [Pseudomonadota bacterium]
MDSYESTKEEIKRSIDIAELIGQFVQLKRAGQSFVGLCPFHSEKDPSFTVSPEKQMFHCFGCKKGGDVFAFWMSYHQVPFPQALQDLADRYHIPLPKRELTPTEKNEAALRQSLISVNKIAAAFYHDLLMKSERGMSGKEYLGKRAMSQELITEFKLGYAPDQWDALTAFLDAKKIDLDKAVQCGLIIQKKNGGYYDRFRGRIMFPIFNLRQEVVGFGGRVLDDSLPKYLNTPETPLFQKGGLLYGLHLSHTPIRQSGRAVIVEGYTDLLALRRHGFREAVATLGTALTRNHIRRLKGYAQEAVVVFDSDVAGKTAALKSLSLFLDEGLSARVLVLPEKEDPDSFVNKYGLPAFLNLLDRSLPMFDFYLDLKLSEAGDAVERKVGALKEIIPILSELKDSAQRSLYVRRLSENAGIAESTVLSELKKWQGRRSWKGEEGDLQARLSSSKAEELAGIDNQYMLNLLIHYPHTVDRLMKLDCRILLSDSSTVEIFDAAVASYRQHGQINPSEVMERLKREPTQGLFREAMLKPPIFPEDKVEQVLSGFEYKVHQLKLVEPSAKAREKSNLEELNKILKLKRLSQSKAI